MIFYNKDINTIFKSLNSSVKGLSQTEVLKQREKYGNNETNKQKKQSFFVKFLLQFKNIMIIILILSAIISSVMAVIQNDYENLIEAGLIFAIVIINALVGVIQEQKAENALESLFEQTKPVATVIRDNKTQKIKIQDIVVGDIISLKTGDYIPADIRLIECSNFSCDESSLTGETHSVEKTNKTLFGQNISLSEQSNMCFSGTSVKSGKALGIVVNTGNNTELGKIAKNLGSTKKEKTPLEKNIDKIGKIISISVLLIVVIVFTVQMLLNKNISFLDALLTAVALAVAAIPESLPAVITIIMALGVQKLAKQNAIVKRLSAVETLGCCNVICTDKTGTITKNEMSVKHVFYSGSLFDASEPALSNDLFLCGAICNNLTLSSKNKLLGDATETAIGNFLLSKHYPLFKTKKDNPVLSASEFNSTKKTMGVVVKIKNIDTLFIKGAADYILPKCTHYLVNQEAIQITNKMRSKIMSEIESVCEQGERVIAFATKTTDISNEENLIFLGFMGIIDPPRDGVKESIKTCKSAGLKTIMITGDHPTTAFAIAKQVGISKHKSETITGNDLDRITNEDLSKIISNYTVFARVTPEHKLRIIQALKHSGNIVAMTGDGINDAPSIKSANIGLCMGQTGTDVTKNAADIIISDDNFSTIVSAIKEGRGIYQNITKTILFLISTNLVEVLGLFVTSLILPSAVFLSPAQILFINLITDSLPAFALGVEPAEKNIMKKPPRNPNNSIFQGSIGTSIIYEGFIQTLVVLVMFVLASHKFGNSVASTMSFLTICLMQIIHAINCKTENSIFKINILNNRFFNFSFVLLFFLVLGISFIPFFANLFSLTKLTYNQWLDIGLTSIAIIPAVELCKLVTKKERI